MRSDGGFTAEDWATIYGAGGASPVPSYLSTHYRRARVRSYPSADFAWLLGFAGLVFVLPVLVGLPLAIRAGVKGNRSAWFAAAWNVAAPSSPSGSGRPQHADRHLVG